MQVERSGDPDDAGDAELSGDDRGVAGGAPLLRHQCDHQGRVESRGVGGGEVLGHEHRRTLGRGDAGLGLPDQVGGHPLADVAQVGDALGHQATHLREHAGEVLDAAVHRVEQRVAVAEVLAHRGAQPLVLGQAGARGQHLGRSPGRLGRATAEPVRHGRRRRVVQGECFLRRVGSGEAVDRPLVDLGAGAEDGSEGEPGDDRGAAQRGGGGGGRLTRRLGGHGHSEHRSMLDSQHIQR